ncbi:MAG TPA: hypothetical protein PLK94_10795 [Alphaproteobacteria bacterium]|nr:hypothetical protein [Alphaproteobacteria bacterium]
MSDFSQDQNDLWQKIAYAVYSDIRAYIDENKSEFEKWLEEAENLDN